MVVDVENPFEQSGEFKVKIIESSNKNGSIRNPYNPEQEFENEFETMSESFKPNVTSITEQSKSSIETYGALKPKQG